MASSPTKFTGWAPKTTTANHVDLALTKFEPKVWDDDDVEIKVLYCGLCGSDAHILDGSWGPLPEDSTYICGHEFVGEIVKVGSAVTDRQVGDYVGIGSQSDSCRECEFCRGGTEQVCPKVTYSIPGFGPAPYGRGKAGAAGSQPKGGFANYWRGPAKFAIPIPKGMDLASAAPMLCGGITMYGPLERKGAGKTAKRVGIVGIGGLGHFGILFAKSMGAEVTAISRSRDKEADAKELGADHFIAMSEGADDYKNTLDLILCTITPSGFDPSPYMDLLRPFGDLCMIGPLAEPMKVSTGPLISRTIGVSGSTIGDPAQIGRMLKLAQDTGIKTWYQKYNFRDINKAFEDFEQGKPRFRIVLVNEENGGKI